MFELAFSGIILICSLGTAFFAIRETRRARASIPKFEDFVKQVNGEWMLEERLAKIIDLFGSRIAHSLRQAMFQQMGVDAKLSKNVDKAIGMDMLNGSGIGGVLDLLGMSETKTMLSKNPKTLGLILQRVAPLLGNIRGGPRPPKSSDEYGKYP